MKKGQTGDEDTDAILAEMEQEGEELPTFADAPQDDESEESEETDEETDEDDDETEESDESEEEESDDEPEDESEEEEETEEEESDGEEEDSEDEDDGEDADDESEENAKVPLWKRLKITKKALRDANDTIKELKSTSTEADLDAKVDEYAKTHGISKEAARDLVKLVADVAAQKVGIDPALKATIDRVVERDRKDAYWKEQDRKYVGDFKSNVLPLAKRDGLDLKDVQTRLQTLAFKPENVKRSLVDLYLEKFAPHEEAKPKRKITSEGSRAHGRVSKGADLENLQAEDLEAMSDEEFDTFSDGLGKSSKSRIVRH